MSYRYDSELVDGKKLWYVTEKTTSQVIKRNLDWEKASKLTKRLNSGQGFAGWTPSFFLETFSSSVFVADEESQ